MKHGFKMDKNKRDYGFFNEKFAEKFLQNKGFKIIDKNFYTRYGEIDIIALDKDTLVFVEVRSRSNKSYGSPLESIDTSKVSKIIKTAKLYISSKNINHLNIRFDVVSVFNGEIEHIENAFNLDYL